MRRIWAAISGLVCVVACGSAGDSQSPGDPEPQSADVTGEAGQPNYDATNTLERTSGNKRMALIAIHDAWQLIAAIDARNGDSAAQAVLALASRAGEITEGPAEETVGSTRSALSEPPNVPPDPGAITCDRSGCSFDNYRHQRGEPFYRLQGTLRFDPRPEGRLLSIDLQEDEEDSRWNSTHITGALIVGETTLSGGVNAVGDYGAGPEAAGLAFSDLTFEPGAFLPEATPLSGTVLGVWHASGPYPERIALIPFP